MTSTLIVFYLSAAVLFCIGFFLCKKSPGSRDELHRMRKSNGHFCMIMSMLPLALGLVTQLYSSNESTANSTTTGDPSSTTDSSTTNGPSESPKTAPDNITVDDSAPDPNAPAQPAIIPIHNDNVLLDNLLLQQAVELLKADQPDEAMIKVNEAFQIDPNDWTVYFVRGNVYAKKQQWENAEKDYRAALQINDHESSIKYNLADIEFLQKKYGAARPGFVGLKQDLALGDISAYKVFLCDLYGGHVDVAVRELEDFNQENSSASYYFANAAWSLYQQKTGDAQNWLASAQKIFAPAKFSRYASSLTVLGYPEKIDPNVLSPSPLQLRP